MVEIGKLKMSSKSSSAVVKQERRDDQEEIDQLAAKMVEANKVKMASLNSTTSGVVANSNQTSSTQRPGQGTLFSYFERSNSGVCAKDAVPTKENISSVDEESAKGRFGWTDSPVHIPYIYRGEEKFCSVRIFEQRVLKMYSNILRPEIYTCISIKSFYITDLEARLFNEINIKHCDCQFGREPFTVRDLIVRLSDVLEFLKFLQTCQDKLIRKSCDPQDRCGFFRIGGESVVPYTVVNNIKYVPLFYFEGETGNLDKKSIQITGWDLAYLKLCCKVQGIRNELFANDSYAAVSVDDIKQQFPAQTDLQLFWPNRSLLDIQTNNSNSSLGTWIQKPSGNPPPLPVTTTSSVIQKTPATTVTPATRPAAPTPAVAQHTVTTAAPVARPVIASSANSSLYGSWNNLSSYAMQQMQQQGETSNAGQSSSSAHLASVLQSSARTQAALLMPTLPVPVHPVNMGLNMNAATALGIHYAQAAQAALLSMQSRPPAPPVTAHSALDTLLRGNGVHSDTLRPPQGSPSTTLMNRSPYSTSQSPLTGVVPGSSPHSRSNTGASPRPGLPVPTSSMNSSSVSSSVPKPPPPLIPVNGSHSLFPSLPTVVSPPRIGNDSSQSAVQHSITRLTAAQQQQLHQQQQQQPPFKLQRLPIENQLVPCVNSRQFVYNNLMMSLPDMAAYLFPHLGHHACKQVLQDGLGVTLYEANPQQLQVLRAAGKISNVNNISGEKIWLVNVRDVVQYMPQIRYMMSSFDGAELNHAPSAKRQRVS